MDLVHPSIAQHLAPKYLDNECKNDCLPYDADELSITLKNLNW